MHHVMRPPFRKLLKCRSIRHLSTNPQPLRGNLPPTRQLRINHSRKKLELMAELCEIRGLSITYTLRDGTRLRAVDDLSLTIASGEIVGILGESGCGKSTLASAILRLLPAHADREKGTVLFRGVDLLTMPESKLREIRGRQISLVPQDPALALNPVLSVGIQIAEVLRAHLPLRAKETRSRVLQLLGEVGFDHPQEIYGAYPHQLSGGQKQRVAIAQAISCQPALIIADEPTSKLDAPLQAEIVALLAKIRREHNLAIMLISHDPALFAGFADRMAVMYAGRIVETGTTAQIFRKPLHPYTQALVQIAKSAIAASARTARQPFSAIAGDSPDPSHLPSGCRFHPRCPERMDVCSQRYPQAFLPEPSRPVSCFKYGE
jgi:oligopeptide/dipeptide ABC transporter ATP-binding protein